jgi:hypothetical protein
MGDIHIRHPQTEETKFYNFLSEENTGYLQYVRENNIIFIGN